jgi:hypothetical protein
MACHALGHAAKEYLQQERTLCLWLVPSNAIREQTIKALQQEVIRELSTPVLPFREGMLLLPIIGQIDSQRARQLTEHPLVSIRANRPRSSHRHNWVATVDSWVANQLQTVDGQLMGAKVVIWHLAGDCPDHGYLGIDLGPVYTATICRTASSTRSGSGLPGREIGSPAHETTGRE